MNDELQLHLLMSECHHNGPFTVKLGLGRQWLPTLLGPIMSHDSIQHGTTFASRTLLLLLTFPTGQYVQVLPRRYRALPHFVSPGDKSCSSACHADSSSVQRKVSNLKGVQRKVSNFTLGPRAGHGGCPCTLHPAAQLLLGVSAIMVMTVEGAVTKSTVQFSMLKVKHAKRMLVTNIRCSSGPLEWHQYRTSTSSADQAGLELVDSDNNNVSMPY